MKSKTNKQTKNETTENQGWEVGGSFKTEGAYVQMSLIHADLRKKSNQYCKEIILQLKIDKLRKRKKIANIRLSSNVVVLITLNTHIKYTFLS